MKSHGGKRVGAGRKKHTPALDDYHIRLEERQAKLVRMWGKGDLSAGLRWLIDAAAPLIRKAGRPDDLRSSG